MKPRPTTTANFAMSLIRVALIGFSIYGFSTHEITLHQSHHTYAEYRVNRSRDITLTGWPADVVRLGLVTVGLLFVTYPVYPDRRTVVRSNIIAVVAWLGISVIVILGSSFTS